MAQMQEQPLISLWDGLSKECDLVNNRVEGQQHKAKLGGAWLQVVGH